MDQKVKLDESQPGTAYVRLDVLCQYGNLAPLPPSALVFQWDPISRHSGLHDLGIVCFEVRGAVQQADSGYVV